MTKLNSNASDKVLTNPGAAIEQLLPNLAITTKPVVITAVQRKVNIGNFETIDVYVGVALPVDIDSMLDQEALETALSATATIGIGIASKETADRYKVIKESIPK